MQKIEREYAIMKVLHSIGFPVPKTHLLVKKNEENPLRKSFFM